MKVHFVTSGALFAVSTLCRLGRPKALPGDLVAVKSEATWNDFHASCKSQAKEFAIARV